ncbi:MAG TPA: aminotransferase class III-fold pyridoxal phosphate-dependent enzyme [Thermoplasmata archaeon]|nr:aminotransferase class III-fold pyridoxal phosphate-dependent enzyme [Thermoplasmata archaeon]
MGRGRGRPFYLPVWYEGTPAERFASPDNTYVRCEGMTIALADGTTLEDWTGQVFVNNIGMGRPEVAKALADQAARMSWLSPAEFAEVRLALTEDLRAVMPRHLTTPFYGIGGSDSIEAAIRAAWKVTGRRNVLTFANSYHGDTITVESVSGGGVMPYGDIRRWAVHTPDPYDAFQASGEWEHAGERTLEGIRTTMRRHGPRSFACVVVEPVMGVAGAVPLSPDLPKGLRELCDRYAIKLVADEVITGFGRTGAWFGSTTVGLKPDAIVVAKGLTGGYAPLGAAVFERSWGATLRKTGFPHGLTFGAHPLGCTAARETIRILRRERLVERCKAVGGYLQRRFEALWQEHPAVVRDVRGHGLLLAMELRAPSRRPVRGGLHPAWRRVARIWKRLRDEGIRVTTNTDGSSLLLCPPFIVTERQVDRLVERLAVHLRAA